jgi:metal-responsive CopG/Arc/MetJ family transcriptional regulator
MARIQITLEERLLRAADREARRLSTNRSELLCRAIRGYLDRRVREAEELERAAYARIPQGPEMISPLGCD